MSRAPSPQLRIGTRGSELALWQAHEVSRRLQEHGYSPELVIVKTTGDKRQDVPLASIGGKGLFIKELEESLERGEIDLAVHSLKDVPSLMPEQFMLAGFLERADPRDAWLHPESLAIADLPPGTIVGTSAPRRRAQLLARHPHLVIEPIRGNVDTRIRKMHAGLYGGLVLASAGLTRLARSSDVSSYFSVEEMLPAAGQGIVAMETLRDHDEARDAAMSITHRQTALAATCERAVLQAFGQRLDCYSCVAVHATIDGSGLTVRAFLSDYDGAHPLRVSQHGLEPNGVVEAVATELLARGALDLLAMTAEENGRN